MKRHRHTLEALAKPLARARGTGILPVFHGRDAHATRGFARTSLFMLLAAAALGAAVAVAENETPPFFDELKDEGAWFMLGESAWAWQPAVMQQDPDWRPYLDGGSWTRHDDANWFWVSEYIWGAIAFHHGRWFETEDYGWLWVPGTQWCPAWVDWRLTPTHSGWAPLPPGDAFFESIGVTNYAIGWQQYAFVPNSAFTARNLRPLMVDGTEFAGEAVGSFTGPAPDQVGYATPVRLGQATTVVVTEPETVVVTEPETVVVTEQKVVTTYPDYSAVRSTIYLREPVLAYTPCSLYHVGYGGTFRPHPRHPACRPPVPVRRHKPSRSARPRPPAPAVTHAPPPRPALAPPPPVHKPAPPPPSKPPLRPRPELTPLHEPSPRPPLKPSQPPRPVPPIHKPSPPPPDKPSRPQRPEPPRITTPPPPPERPSFPREPARPGPPRAEAPRPTPSVAPVRPATPRMDRPSRAPERPSVSRESPHPKPSRTEPPKQKLTPQERPSPPERQRDRSQSEPRGRSHRR